MAFSSHHIKNACYQPDLLLADHLVGWLRWCSSGFSSVKCFLLLGGSHHVQTTLQEWGVKSACYDSGGQSLYKLFRNLHGRFVPSPFINFFHLYQYKIKGLCFILWIIIHYHFVAQTVLVLAIKVLLIDSCVPLMYPQYHGLFSFWNTSLLHSTTNMLLSHLMYFMFKF